LYNKLGYQKSLKIYILHTHLDFFPENLGTVSDRQGERFYQKIELVNIRYQGFWNDSMLMDYYWMLCRNVLVKNYKRKSFSQHF